MAGSLNIQRVEGDFTQLVAEACRKGFTPIYDGTALIGYILSPRELQRLEKEGVLEKTATPPGPYPESD